MNDERHADCVREVEELHAFFAAWFSGDTADFARVSEALASDFVIVSPDGWPLPRGVLLERLRNARGRGRIEIEIRSAGVRSIAPGVHLVRYEEWQRPEGRDWKGRISSAILLDDDAGPNRLRWHHLHETWKAEEPDT